MDAPKTQWLGQSQEFPLPANTAATAYPAQSPTKVIIVNAADPALIGTTETDLPDGRTLIRVDWIPQELQQKK